MDQYPKLRPVEPVPVEVEKRRCIYLRDPQGYATDGLLLYEAAVFVVSHFDGRHSIEDIQQAFARRFGQPLPAAEIQQLVNQLDAHYYLENERFASLERETRERFLSAPVRPLAHAGTSYEADPEKLRAQLSGFFADPKGPGPSDGMQRGPALRGLIAPHIDLRVGGPTYAWAYRELAERSDAEVFVLLGTSHQGGSHPFILTAKDFETPLGTVKADCEFIERLSAAYGRELSRDEPLHRNEHSLEFQALFLQYVLGEVRPFSIVPILVSSFHHMIDRGLPPVEDPAIGEFTQALQRVIAEETRPICIVAGVDFAHVGHKFGDSEGLDPEFLAWVEAEDRALINVLEKADSAAFFQEIAKNRDRRRICGFAPMYTLLASLPESQGRLLHYDRNDEAATRSAVSFASLAFE